MGVLLIITSARDLAADYLIVRLIEQGLPYFRLNSEDVAEATLSFHLGDAAVSKRIAVGMRELDVRDVSAVWYRRTIHPTADRRLTPAERLFVNGELRHLVTGLVLNPDILWVNPIDKVATAEHKLFQLQVARETGLSIPETLVSSDPGELVSFIATHPMGTICKPIYHGLFVDGDKRASVYTRRVRQADILDGPTEIGPVLLQEEIPRSADVRVTFIGDDCYSADVLVRPGTVDWRAPGSAEGYRASEVGGSTRSLCLAMLRQLGLSYGAFDFIRKPNGELVFLEVNPTGEWAWLEDQIGFPMRESFVKLLYGHIG